MARIALSTQMSATPTSANTAAHMPARPTTASSSTPTLTASAMAMFCRAMARTRAAMRSTCGRRSISSVISTTSAASMAASLPSAPMATPTSARIRDGASLMPSPTKAAAPDAQIASSRASLSPGSSWACTSSTPSAFATARAGASRSPVSMTVLSMPSPLSAASASRAPGLGTSARHR